ncbi:hypothetical protein BC936DRAFT_146046 [Jimgerdemannia flammicorona]|uniref:Uncharacterized protein n=1 Tax=Jimgerdemannia flammicorona TaxID=994334 RepID=A0A433D8L7_9FUNG|nr:hypothetical protein BC936DRAFT_146046 [Jimgerdemannia flammicorona]
MRIAPRSVYNTQIKSFEVVGHMPQRLYDSLEHCGVNGVAYNVLGHFAPNTYAIGFDVPGESVSDGKVVLRAWKRNRLNCTLLLKPSKTDSLRVTARRVRVTDSLRVTAHRLYYVHIILPMLAGSKPVNAQKSILAGRELQFVNAECKQSRPNAEARRNGGETTVHMRHACIVLQMGHLAPFRRKSDVIVTGTKILPNK